MFPKISQKLSRKKDNNKADAILIAKYFENTKENNEWKVKRLRNKLTLSLATRKLVITKISYPKMN